MVVAKGTTLLNALQAYSKDNPTILKLETETHSLRTSIKSVNGIAKDERSTTHWFMDAIFADGKNVPLTTNVATTVIEDADEVVYRMTYKTTDLSL
jgi:hypothetical protein